MLKEHLQRKRVHYPISDVRLLRLSKRMFKAAMRSCGCILRVSYSRRDAVVCRLVEGENPRRVAISWASG
jgi:hypothetical protein